MRKRIWLGLAMVSSVWLLADRARHSEAQPEPVAAPVPRDAQPLVQLIERLPIAQHAANEPPADEAPTDEAPTDEIDEAERDQLDAIIGKIPAGEGAAFGEIRDIHSGEPVARATIAVTSIDDLHAPEYIAHSDELGRYAVIGLPPGAYKVRLYYNKVTVDGDDLVVEADGATSAPFDIDADLAPAPEPPPPVITVTLPGRTFVGVIGDTAGSQEENIGVWIRSRWAVENEFLEETEVISH